MRLSCPSLPAVERCCCWLPGLALALWMAGCGQAPASRVPETATSRSETSGAAAGGPSTNGSTAVATGNAPASGQPETRAAALGESATATGPATSTVPDEGDEETTAQSQADQPDRAVAAEAANRAGVGDATEGVAAEPADSDGNSDDAADGDLLALQQTRAGARAPGAINPKDRTAGGRYQFRRLHDPNGIGKFYLGREIAHVMGFAGAPWLERPEREREEATSRMIKALDLKPGMTVADIGAGSGVITVLMAKEVLPGGRVVAVDVQQEMLDLLADKLKSQQVENVDLLLGTAKSPRLEPESIDLALMVDVYHELEFPYEMLLELSRAMKPGGRVVFVEFRLEDPDVPIKLVHKMSQAQVKRELSPPELQLRFKENIGVLPWQHVVVFEKVGPDGGFPQPVNTQPETTPKSTPDQALENVRLPEGFRASLFAAEPAVRQPIAICTDERGRLWVAENYSYAESSVNFDRAQRDRIVILEDADGDGVHDSRRVFWDEGQLLTSVEVGFGGVFVLCAPKLLFIPDLDRDDIPDGPPVTLLDGFDDGPVRHNIVNGLKWGPDGWLYGRHGILATSQVGPPGATPSQRTRLNCGVWRYEPISRRFEVVAHGTTNPWGHDWNDHGELFFINTVIGHLWHVIPGAHFRRMYGSDFNPRTYQLIEQTADHFHWDTREAWSDIRKGVTDTTSAAGGGHAHSGLMLYLGDNWPAEYRDSVLTVNLHGRRLNRDVLERDAAGYTARHRPDMVFFDDQWFRGIDLLYGPDGGVFVADWSDIGECHENDGVHRDSGRIFKITHGVPKPGTVARDLGGLDSRELAELCLQANDWYVRQARRLLRERAVRGDTDLQPAADRLREIFATHADVTRRLRAMWALWGMGQLKEPDLLAAVRDPDEHVAAWAVRFLVDTPPSAAAVAALVEVAETTSGGLTLLHLAGALQRLELSDRLPLANRLVRRHEFAGDRAYPLMIWYGLEPAVPGRESEPWVELLRAVRVPVVGRLLSRRLTEEIDARPELLDSLVGLLLAPADTLAGNGREDVLTGIADGLRGRRQAKAPARWSEVAAALGPDASPALGERVRELSVVFGDGRAADELKALVKDSTVDPAARRQALAALAESRVEGLAELALSQLGDRAVDTAAMRALASVEHPEAAARILGVMGRLDAESRQTAIEALVARPASSTALLNAVAAGQIRRNEVTAYHARQIRSFGDATLTARLAEVWGETRETPAEKQALLERYRGVLTPDAVASANLSAGRAVFNKVCASCHVLYGQGKNAGPDLTGGNRRNLDYLLENVVDPSGSVAADFRLSVIELQDGRVINGVVVERSAATLVVQAASERLTIPANEVVEIRQTAESLMPEGLLTNLTEAEVRDLVGYLQSTAQVPLPASETP